MSSNSKECTCCPPVTQISHSVLVKTHDALFMYTHAYTPTHPHPHTHPHTHAHTMHTAHHTFASMHTNCILGNTTTLNTAHCHYPSIVKVDSKAMNMHRSKSIAYKWKHSNLLHFSEVHIYYLIKSTANSAQSLYSTFNKATYVYWHMCQPCTAVCLCSINEIASITM